MTDLAQLAYLSFKLRRCFEEGEAHLGSLLGLSDSCFYLHLPNFDVEFLTTLRSRIELLKGGNVRTNWVVADFIVLSDNLLQLTDEQFNHYV